MAASRPPLLFLAVLAFAGPASAAAPPSRLLDLYGDPLPPGAVARLGTVRWRYYWGFYDPACSPDGRLLLSRSFGGKALLWDAASGRLLRTAPRRYPAAFSCYAFLLGGRRLLSHDLYGGNFYLWDIPSFRLVRRWEGETLSSLAVSADGRLATGIKDDGTAHVINLATGKARGYRGGDGAVEVAFTPDGCLAVLGKPGEQRFVVSRLDLLTGRLVRRLRIGAAEARLAPDGRHVAAVSPDGQVSLWNVETARQLPLEGMPDPIVFVTVAFRPDGRQLVVADRVTGGALCTYDLGRGTLISRARLPEGLWSDRPAVSPDGRLLFDTWVLSNHLTRVSVRTGKPADALAGFAHTPHQLAWGAGAGTLVALDLFEATWWDTAVGRLRRRVSLSDEGPPSLYGVDTVTVIAPDSRAAAGRERRQPHITLMDCSSGKVTHHLRGHGAEVVALAFSGDGRRLVSADRAGQVRLWDVASGRPLRAVDAAKARDVRAVLLTPDGAKVVAVEQSGGVHLWDARTGGHLRTLRPAEPNPPEQPGVEAPLTAAAISPSGDRLAVSYRGRLRVCDLATSRQESFDDGPGPGALPPAAPALSFSADGRFLARVDGGLSLYEAASGRVVHRFRGRCDAAAFHPTRPRVAAAHQQRVDVLIWDLKKLFLSQPPDKAATPSLWSGLLDRDAACAQRALWRMAVTPGMEDYLAGRLRPVLKREAAWLRRQIADLASDHFATREQAEQALADAGDAAGPAMREALGKTPDLEQRNRLSRLLDRLEARSPERLREHRAVFALEARGTPEARRLLERLARGMPGARLTEEAKAALSRVRP